MLLSLVIKFFLVHIRLPCEFMKVNINVRTLMNGYCMGIIINGIFFHVLTGESGDVKEC